MMAPSLAMAAPTSAICSTVAWGPAGLSCSPTGSPQAAQAVSQVVISSGSGMRDVARGKSKGMSSLKPKLHAICTSKSLPSCTPTWPNTVFDEYHMACSRVILP